MPDEVNDDTQLNDILPGDPMLRHILGLVHCDLLHPRITIAVNGLLISGKAISEVEYLKEFVSQNKVTYGQYVSQVTESLVRRYRQRTKEIGKARRHARSKLDAQYGAGTLENVEEIVDEVSRHLVYVFLNDVRFFTAGNNSPIPIKLWRCRLDAVDGFSIDEIGAPPLR